MLREPLARGRTGTGELRCRHEAWRLERWLQAEMAHQQKPRAVVDDRAGQVMGDEGLDAKRSEHGRRPRGAHPKGTEAAKQPMVNPRPRACEDTISRAAALTSAY